MHQYEDHISANKILRHCWKSLHFELCNSSNRCSIIIRLNVGKLILSLQLSRITKKHKKLKFVQRALLFAVCSPFRFPFSSFWDIISIRLVVWRNNRVVMAWRNNDAISNELKKKKRNLINLLFFAIRSNTIHRNL